MDADGTRTQAGKGHMTTICAERLASGQLSSKELPTAIREKICAAPAEVLARPQSV